MRTRWSTMVLNGVEGSPLFRFAPDRVGDKEDPDETNVVVESGRLLTEFMQKCLQLALRGSRLLDAIACAPKQMDTVSHQFEVCLKQSRHELRKLHDSSKYTITLL